MGFENCLWKGAECFSRSVGLLLVEGGKLEGTMSVEAGSRHMNVQYQVYRDFSVRLYWRCSCTLSFLSRYLIILMMNWCQSFQWSVHIIEHAAPIQSSRTFSGNRLNSLHLHFQVDR